MTEEYELPFNINIIGIGFILLIIVTSVWSSLESQKVGEVFCKPKGFDYGQPSTMLYPFLPVQGFYCVEKVEHCIEGEYCRIVNERTYFGLEKQGNTKAVK